MGERQHQRRVSSFEIIPKLDGSKRSRSTACIECQRLAIQENQQQQQCLLQPQDCQQCCPCNDDNCKTAAAACSIKRNLASPGAGIASTALIEPLNPNIVTPLDDCRYCRLDCCKSSSKELSLTDGIPPPTPFATTDVQLREESDADVTGIRLQPGINSNGVVPSQASTLLGDRSAGGKNPATGHRVVFFLQAQQPIVGYHYCGTGTSRQQTVTDDGRAIDEIGVENHRLRSNSTGKRHQLSPSISKNASWTTEDGTSSLKITEPLIGTRAGEVTQSQARTSCTEGSKKKRKRTQACSTEDLQDQQNYLQRDPSPVEQPRRHRRRHRCPHQDGRTEEVTDGKCKRCWTTVMGSILADGRKRCVTASVVLSMTFLVGLAVGIPLALREAPAVETADIRMRRISMMMKEVPLIDGHNDLAWNIRQFKQNQLRTVNFSMDFLATVSHPWSTSPWSQTDLVRLKDGLIGAQFWSAYAPCGSQDYNAVQIVLEQIDVIKRFIEQYSDILELAGTSEEISRIHASGKIASLIGVEGGHSLGNSLGVLRMLHDLGAKYLSLTHSCDTPWAESDGPRRASDSHYAKKSGFLVGLSEFGRRVVREMNRIGMMVDLSHSSLWTMQHALEESVAPVIFSHSGAQGVCNNSRNVPDEILRLLALKDGIIMIPFYPPFISCSSSASVHDVIAHMNHIRKVIGVDYIGIGSDFDGIDLVPTGLEDVSKYPHLLAELMAQPGWSEEDVKKVAGKNFLRVFRKVEEVSKHLKAAGVMPEEFPILPTDLRGHLNCTYLGDR